MRFGLTFLFLWSVSHNFPGLILSLSLARREAEQRSSVEREGGGVVQEGVASPRLRDCHPAE